jgi:1-deoxy-D-xylulose-5-phosphate reductoisomerase
LAQLGTADMRVPIAYGLHWPQRGASGSGSLNLCQFEGLTFESIATLEHKKRFPCMNLAWESLSMGGDACIALNAANEISVDAFISGDIRFDQIFTLNSSVLQHASNSIPASLEALIDADKRYRLLAKEALRKL